MSDNEDLEDLLDAVVARLIERLEAAALQTNDAALLKAIGTALNELEEPEPER